MGDREKVAETLARSETLLAKMNRSANISHMVLLVSMLIVVPCALVTGINSLVQISVMWTAAKAFSEAEAELARMAAEAAAAEAELARKDAEAAAAEKAWADAAPARAESRAGQEEKIVADFEAAVARVEARKARRLAFEEKWQLANPDGTAVEMRRAYEAYERDWERLDATAKASTEARDETRTESAEP